MTKTQSTIIFFDLVMAGILAGLFLTYSFAVMPGLATVDDRTFVAAFQGLERMFGGFDYGVNWPILGFVGVPLFTLVAIAQNWRRPHVWLLVAALILSVATIVISLIFHVPFNNALTAAGDPTVIDVTQVRVDFREHAWRTWNHVRSATTVGAFVCLGLALSSRGNSKE